MARDASLLGTARGIAVALVVAGFLVLFGWAYDIPALKSLVPGLVTMKPNAAACFMLLGSGLWFAVLRPLDGATPRIAATFLPVLVATIALLTLGQYAFGGSFGIDQLLFEEPAGTPGTAAPGRMAVMTAINFTVLAAALLLIDRYSTTGKRPSNWLGLFVGGNAFLAVLGYAFGVEALYQVVVLSSMALPTALLFLLACLGVVLARPDADFLRKCLEDSPSGEVIRRLLPAALVISPILAWLRWQGELAGYYSTAFGLALYATSNVTVFAILVWRGASAVRRTHGQHVEQLRINDWQEAIMDSANLTMISTDVDGVIRTINAGAAHNLGYQRAEVVGRVTPALIHDTVEVAARAAVLERELGRPVEPGFDAFVALARMGRVDENDWTYVRKDGSRFPVRLSVTAMRDAEGNLSGFVGIGRDLSAQRLAEQALREADERLKLITDNLPVLISFIDSERRFRFNNRTYSDWLRKPLDQVTGARVDEVYDPATYALIEPHLERALAGETVSFDFSLPGSEQFVHGTYIPQLDESGRVTGVYGLISDISSQKAAEASLRRMAQFDNLTGLANRRRFEEKLAEAIARSERSSLPMALIFIDFDHFKAVNDSVGHAGGDQVLQELARRLTHSVRQTDTVARLAGDEFVVVVESLAHAGEAETVARKICEAMAEPFTLFGKPQVLSVSMGIAVRRQGDLDGAGLLHRADAALYQVKGGGRGTFAVAD